jgi:hypothetical protein
VCGLAGLLAAGRVAAAAVTARVRPRHARRAIAPSHVCPPARSRVARASTRSARCRAGPPTAPTPLQERRRWSFPPPRRSRPSRPRFYRRRCLACYSPPRLHGRGRRAGRGVIGSPVVSCCVCRS